MKIIYPSFKIVLRFSTIMALLFSVTAFISRYTLFGLVLVFISSFLIVFFLPYLFKIRIKGEYIQIFQYFIYLDSININDIYAISCTSHVRGLKGSVLNIATKFGSKTYPIRLYDQKRINSLVSSLNIIAKNKNEKSKQI